MASRRWQKMDARMLVLCPRCGAGQALCAALPKAEVGMYTQIASTPTAR
jgi:hypothetical protein